MRSSIFDFWTDEKDPAKPLLLGDLAAARVAIRGSTWLSEKKIACIELQIKQVQTRPRMVALLENILLNLPCTLLNKYEDDGK